MERLNKPVCILSDIEPVAGDLRATLIDADTLGVPETVAQAVAPVVKHYYSRRANFRHLNTWHVLYALHNYPHQVAFFLGWTEDEVRHAEEKLLALVAATCRRP